MKLFLIRHGETEHNVAGLLAGVTDSRLTNHGILQTQRLGKSFVDRNIFFSHFFSSDLSRAYLTAQALVDAQATRWPDEKLWRVHQTPLLREQDFGSLECTSWASRGDKGFNSTIPDPNDPSFIPKESQESMKARADQFWDEHMLPLLPRDSQITSDQTPPITIAIVSHGLFLSTLWPNLLSRFGPQSVMLGPEVSSDTVGRPLQYLPAWGNTGVLELDLIPPSASLSSGTILLADPIAGVADSRSQTSGASGSKNSLRDWKMVLRQVNGRAHLHNLRRTGGGVGSATFDAKQKNLDTFFKRA